LLSERYIIRAASSFPHLHPLHTTWKEQQKNGRGFKTERGKELPTERGLQLAHLANGKCSFFNAEFHESVLSRGSRTRIQPLYPPSRSSKDGPGLELSLPQAIPLSPKQAPS